MTVPVLLLVFNRPAHAVEVVERVAGYRPDRLFVAADGPRAGVDGEAERCELTRRLVLEHVTWPCSVETLFRDSNLGCGPAVSEALAWFFGQVEEGIVLEDDCVADPSFFPFCAEMLERYRSRPEVAHVNGSNFQLGRPRGEASYYWSRYAHVWGWASWRRTWEMYDFTLERYQDWSRDGLNRRQRHDLERVLAGGIDTWDIQWAMSAWFNGGLSITPNVSLVRNTGYGDLATHTMNKPRWLDLMEHGGISELRHPSQIVPYVEADQFTQRVVFDSGLSYRVKQLIKRVRARVAWKPG